MDTFIVMLGLGAILFVGVALYKKRKTRSKDRSVPRRDYSDNQQER